MGFRPLIRGFFFYCSLECDGTPETVAKFPSPYSGILFLFRDYHFNIDGDGEIMFPSPYSGILFLCVVHGKIKGNALVKVSVPLFGDSFFIDSSCGDFGERYDVVSVPLFGDSFFILSL